MLGFRGNAADSADGIKLPRGLAITNFWPDVADPHPEGDAKCRLAIYSHKGGIASIVNPAPLASTFPRPFVILAGWSERRLAAVLAFGRA
jgi:hypothetical protein